MNQVLVRGLPFLPTGIADPNPWLRCHGLSVDLDWWDERNQATSAYSTPSAGEAIGQPCTA